MKSLPTQWNKAQQFFEDFLWVVLTICLPAHPSDRRNAPVLPYKQNEAPEEGRKAVGGWVWTVAKLGMTAFFRALAFQDAIALSVQYILVMTDKAV